MSSAIPVVAEKVDVRKYLLVLKRRKWWGLVPFTVLAVSFGVICAAMPAKYLSQSVIRASKSQVAVILQVGGPGPGAAAGTAEGRTRTILEFVKMEMVRKYDNVMNALAGTDLLADIQRQSEGNPILNARLQDELYRRINRNTTVSALSDVSVQVDYLGDDPRQAQTVLSRLVNQFVENALESDRANARQAQTISQNDMRQAEGVLVQADDQLVRFNEDHTGISETAGATSRDLFNKVRADVEEIGLGLEARKSKLQKYIELLEDMPRQTVVQVKTTSSPEVLVARQRLAELQSQLGMSLRVFTPLHPTVKDLQKQIAVAEETLANTQQQAGEDQMTLETNRGREELEQRKLELEAEINYQTEVLRILTARRTRLEEEVRARPALEREYNRLARERAAAGERQAAAQKEFQRVNQDFNMKMEGLVSFSVDAPARVPQTSDIRHILRLAVMGLFVSLAAGMGAIVGMEFLDQSFTDVETARAFLRLPSLGVIPLIETRRNRRVRWLRYLIVLAVFAAVAAAIGLTAWLKIPPLYDVETAVWQWITDLAKVLAK